MFGQRKEFADIRYKVVTHDTLNGIWQNELERKALLNALMHRHKYYNQPVYLEHEGDSIQNLLKKTSFVLALTPEKKFIGFIEFTRPEKTIITERTFVIPEMRRQGVTVKMTLHLIGWARAHGFADILRTRQSKPMGKLAKKLRANPRGTGKGIIVRDRHPEEIIIEREPTSHVRAHKRVRIVLH